MNNPSLYDANSVLTKHHAKTFVDQYVSKMPWSNEDIIMDAGCGGGSITRDILRTHCPAFAEIVGVDKSDKMISFARDNFPHEKISYTVMDIVEVKQPRSLFPKGFNKIFSFFCFHWIQNQTAAIKNFYQLLNPGGYFLTTFFAQHTMFDLYETLAQKKRWEKYMTDVQQFITIQQKSTEPEKEFRQILEECGFNVIDCMAPDFRFSFESEDTFKNIRRAVDPFIERMPTDLQEEYMADYFNEVVNDPSNLLNGKITSRYKLMAAFAQKPF